jgi:hypothetical protein
VRACDIREGKRRTEDEARRRGARDEHDDAHGWRIKDLLDASAGECPEHDQ